MTKTSSKDLFKEILEFPNSKVYFLAKKYVSVRKIYYDVSEFVGDECTTIYSGHDKKEFEKLLAEYKEKEVFQ